MLTTYQCEKLFRAFNSHTWGEIYSHNYLEIWMQRFLQSCMMAKNFNSTNFFNNNPEGLKLIFYQDSFEILNPLGSAKKKHKVLAMYLSVANLPIHLRSNTDMFLVLLCIEHDLKCFGIAKIFLKFLVDLKSLETNGINVDGVTVKGVLYCIAGDNLGSHCIGKFTENFIPLNILAGTVKSRKVTLRLIRMPVVIHTPQSGMTRLLLISRQKNSKLSKE